MKDFKLFIAFLTAMGVKKATIDTLVAEQQKDEESKFDVSTFVTEFREQQNKLFENDPDFVNKFTTAEKAKQQDIYTRLMKKTFGLTAEQVKDKTLDEIIVLAKETGAVGDADVKTLQKEVTELTGKLQEYETITIPKIKGEVDTHKKAIETDNVLVKKLLAKKLRVPLQAVEPALKSFLSQGYEVFVNDKGDLDYTLKGSKMKEKTKDGTSLLEIDQIIDGKLDEWQFLEKSNGSEGDKKITTITPVGDPGGEGNAKPKVYSPHLAAAQKKLDEIKEAAKAPAE